MFELEYFFLNTFFLSIIVSNFLMSLQEQHQYLVLYSLGFGPYLFITDRKGAP